MTYHPEQRPPVAMDDIETTPFETPVQIEVLSNDFDTDGDSISIVSSTAPSNGAVVTNADGTMTYTPNNGFSGMDTYSYTITDGNGGYDSATVTIVVEPS